MSPRRPTIAAFGSSRVSEQDPRFHDAELLCEKLARAGFDGLTGGHQGMMAAFAQGIHKGGGHVRGITLERFPTPPGNKLSEETRAHDFFDRMRQLIEEADAYLVLPGGLGTLAELAMSWDLLAIRVLESRPLAIYGEMWEPVLNVLHKQLIMSVNHGFESILLCGSHEEAIQHFSPILKA